MKIYFPILLLAALCFCGNDLYATHNMAGEITFEKVGPNTIQATIATYTFLESRPADRDSLFIDWGDGTTETLIRINGEDTDNDGTREGEVISEFAKKNLYVGRHTYAAEGSYYIGLADPNRNGGIMNVNFPNSSDIQFYIETELHLSEDPEMQNNSPQLLMPPIDVAIVGQTFMHNPNAFDPDGDSLSYELITPLQDHDESVRNYRPVTEIMPGPENQISIDAVTGTIVWDAPQQAGVYNIAMRIISYRNGAVIDQVIRDMQVIVEDRGFVMPEILTDFSEGEVIEVGVGDSEVDVELFSRSLNDEGTLTFTAESGLFVLPEKGAKFEIEEEDGQLKARFVFQPEAWHLREQPYLVVFKARESFDGIGWATIKVLRIKVVDTVVDTDHAIVNPLQVKLFPNPSNQYLVTQISAEAIGAPYEIRTATGQMIRNGWLNDINTNISLERFAAGTYYMSIGQGRGKIVKTFVKR